MLVVVAPYYIASIALPFKCVLAIIFVDTVDPVHEPLSTVVSVLRFVNVQAKISLALENPIRICTAEELEATPETL